MSNLRYGIGSVGVKEYGMGARCFAMVLKSSCGLTLYVEMSKERDNLEPLRGCLQGPFILVKIKGAHKNEGNPNVINRSIHFLSKLRSMIKLVQIVMITTSPSPSAS